MSYISSFTSGLSLDRVHAEPSSQDKDEYKSAPKIDAAVIEPVLANLKKLDIALSSKRSQMIFVTANETNCTETLQVLKKVSSHLPAVHCHIGISGLFNWQIAAITKPELIIMIDINPAMCEFYKKAVELIQKREVPDEDTFATELAKSCMMQKDFDYFNYTIRCENRDLRVGPSWKWDEASNRHVCKRSKELDSKFVDAFVEVCGSEIFSEVGSFEYLKEMAEKGRIIVLEGDLASTERMKQIVTAIASFSPVGTLYISNSYDWLLKRNPENKMNFAHNIAHLSSDFTLIIDAIPGNTKIESRKFEFENMQQNIFFKKDPGSGKEYDPNLVRDLDEQGRIIADDKSERAKLFSKAPLLKQVHAPDEKAELRRTQAALLRGLEFKKP